MKFNLEIYRDKGNDGYELTDTFKEVDVQWSEWEMNAVAIKDNVQVAIMSTFSDYPIEINESDILIEGITHPNTDRTYGHWKLTAL